MSFIHKFSACLGILFFVFTIGCGSPLIQELATPSISQILPQPIPAGTGDTAMTVQGANFTSETVILWNSSTLATTAISSSTLSVVVPAAKLAQPGTVQVQVQNGSAGTASLAVPLAIVSPNATVTSLTIATPTFASGLVGTSYSTILAASGGTAPYKWSISSGSLPAGLTLAASTGVIAGTPTAAGTFNFGITATDSSKSAATAKATGTIVIAPKPLAIRTTALGAGTNGVAYSQDLLATGGTPAYTWSISSGTLPTGLTLAASTGVISGTPTVNGTFALGLTVKDSGSPQQTATLTTSIVLAPKPVTITTTSLASGIAGTAYSQMLTATGGTPNYTWTMTSGSLPTGLSLSTTGIISGTTRTNGTFSFGVTVSDSGSPVTSNSTAMMLTIATRALSISTDGLAVGDEGVAYSQSLAARGGAAPYTWSLTAGSVLPTGLTLAPSGLISGTPTAGGNFDFGVQVVDSSSPQQSASLSTLIVISPSTMTISTTSLAPATISSAYSQTLAAAGGTPNFRWSITSGALPAGLSLSAWTGVISGTPTVNGTFALGVTVTDRSNPQQTATATLSLTVAAPQLVIATSTLPSATAAATYSATLSASGGTAPYAWSGTLPTGLSMASTGVISGTPTATGTFSVGVTVTDSCLPSALSKSATLTLVVTPSALTITASALTSGTQGVAYAQALAASGGTPAYTWSISSGALPAGLTLAATTGVISGTPTASGTASLAATVTDNGTPSQKQSVATSIIVAPAVAATPGTTWYIRPDGGTRYSAAGGGNVPTGGCNGTTDAAYPGLTNQTWFPNHAYALGTIILGHTGYYETVTKAGTSASSFWPSWSATTTDGTAVWSQGAAYPQNQNCAFDDFRFLYDNQNYNGISSGWVIAGGDTVVVRGCYNVDENNNGATYCRVGTSPPANVDYWCVGGQGIGACSSGTIPAGTSGAHTRILGQCVLAGNCNTGNTTIQANLTQLFGGGNVGTTINLIGAQYVDLQGFNITDHSQCVSHGYPAYPKACGSTDDYGYDGIATSNTTAPVLLQDLWIHGFSDSGLTGPVGNGTITMNRVNVSFNGFSGWNFQNLTADQNGANAAIAASYVMMEGNGCNEEYPIVHTGFPAESCYDLLSMGFGDSWSGQTVADGTPGLLVSFTCDHCQQIYNTKDGFIGPHVNITTLKVTNSASYGNMGQQWKWTLGANSTALFENNLTVGNCDRLAYAPPGAPHNYNQTASASWGGAQLTDFCRAAGDMFSISADANSTTTISNSTMIGYNSTIFDLHCNTAGACGASPYIFKNNILLGYTNQDPFYEASDGYTGKAPGLYYTADTSTAHTASYNIEHGIRNGDTCGGSIYCVDPLLVTEPVAPMTSELQLDNFNFSLTSSSPAIGAGTTGGSSTDYNDVVRPAPPSIGAVDR